MSLPANLTRRAIGPDDEEILFAIYASTRTEELAQVDWTDAQKQQFLRMQYAAQRAHYARHYAESSFELILLGGVPAGRLYVARGESEIRVVDIALLPEYRRRGIGEGLLREILDEGTKAGKTVSIHVERFNPAQRLYERLGFRRVQETGPYYLLERRPGDRAPEQ